MEMDYTDYRYRLLTEQEELSNRIYKLSQFIYTEVYENLPEEDAILLASQLGAMIEYNSILNKRIKREYSA